MNRTPSHLAEVLGAPIIKAGLGKDCVPGDSPYTTGGMGLIGTPASHEALGTCDGFLIVGSSNRTASRSPPPFSNTTTTSPATADQAPACSDGRGRCQRARSGFGGFRRW